MLRLVALALSNAEIAERLVLTEATPRGSHTSTTITTARARTRAAAFAAQLRRPGDAASGIARIIGSASPPRIGRENGLRLLFQTERPNEPDVVGQHHGLNAVAQTELAEHRGDMLVLDRLREIQLAAWISLPKLPDFPDLPDWLGPLVRRGRFIVLALIVVLLFAGEVERRRRGDRRHRADTE